MPDRDRQWTYLPRVEGGWWIITLGPNGDLPEGYVERRSCNWRAVAWDRTDSYRSDSRDGAVRDLLAALYDERPVVPTFASARLELADIDEPF